MHARGNGPRSVADAIGDQAARYHHPIRADKQYAAHTTHYQQGHDKGCYLQIVKIVCAFSSLQFMYYADTACIFGAVGEKRAIRKSATYLPGRSFGSVGIVRLKKCGG